MLPVIKNVTLGDCVKTHLCSLNGEPTSAVPEPRVSLFVKMTPECNADCDFCVARPYKSDVIDVDVFKRLYTDLSSKIVVTKVSFTGGEPTTDPKVLSECAKFVKECSPNTHTFVSTNGDKIKQYLDIEGAVEAMDTITISRHHYDDAVNDKIFGTHVLTANDITTIAKVAKRTHLSCNLMRSYISNTVEVEKYLDAAADISGVQAVGLVSLMKVNAKAMAEFIDFDDLRLDPDVFFNNLTWTYEDSCKCKNFLYITKTDPVRVMMLYARYISHKESVKGSLVYDGVHLRNGFNKDIVVL